MIPGEFVEGAPGDRGAHILVFGRGGDVADLEPHRNLNYV